MTKTMGIQYKIVANGEWNKIAELVRATKELVRNTIPKDFFSNTTRVEDKILTDRLTAYLTPKENERFIDYKNRFIEASVGDGFKGAIASLLVGQKVPFNLTLTQNKGESTLLVDVTARNKRYDAVISVSGIYSDRGASIATGLKDLLEKNQVQHTYRTLDRLI